MPHLVQLDDHGPPLGLRLLRVRFGELLDPGHHARGRDAEQLGGAVHRRPAQVQEHGRDFDPQRHSPGRRVGEVEPARLAAVTLQALHEAVLDMLPAAAPLAPQPHRPAPPAVPPPTDMGDLRSLKTLRKNNPHVKMYTLEPREFFVLADLFTPDKEQPSLASFKANVFRGHLERGGERIAGLEDVDVNVKRVVVARKFEPTDGRSDHLSYVLFGKGQELFLAHWISKPPDFDQILSVTVKDPPFTDEDLAHGLSVTVLDRDDSAAGRLKENDEAVGQGHVTGAHQFLDLDLRV